MNEPTPTRVMIVDDHALVRSGLRVFLLAFDDLELVGEAANGEEALRLCKQLQPDVVLMDLVMSGMDGVAATRAIRERWPQIQVVALTSFWAWLRGMLTTKSSPCTTPIASHALWWKWTREALPMLKPMSLTVSRSSSSQLAAASLVP